MRAHVLFTPWSLVQMEHKPQHSKVERSQFHIQTAVSSSGKDQTHIVTVNVHWLHLLSRDGDCVPGWTTGNSQFDSRQG
jgi:hypothetical protein